MTRDRSRTAALLAVATGIWVLTDLVRVWAPSLITIFGQAASTPPELMGAYALGCVLLGVVAAFVARRHATGAGWIALAVTVVARVALQLTDGGQPQLVVASVGVAAGVAWLSLSAASLGDVLVVGLAAGTALGVITHAALGTWGAVWRDDVWSWLVLCVQVAGAASAWWFARGRHPEAVARRTAWLVMPGLLLVGIVLGNAGRASAVGGDVGLVAVAVASVIAILTASLRPGRAAAWAATVVLVGATAIGLLVTTDVGGIPAVAPAWTVVVSAIGLPALTLLWSTADHGNPARPTSLALGALAWVALLFVYYAGYDLGYRADIVLVLAAVVIGVLAATARPRPARNQGPRFSPVLLAAFAVAAAVLAWAGPAATITPLDGGNEDDGLRVTAYNVRMGYGMDGTFRPDLVAETLRDQDVALLSEVDRAWHLNGGQDQLAILERLLERSAVFAPAADPVWGDAVLTALPVLESVGNPLPSHGAVTGAQALSVLVDVDGTPTWFVSTHLQPNDGDEGVEAQTEDLVKVLRARLADGHPLVLGGDLNTQPGSEAFRQLTELGLVDGLEGAGPTSPADRPTARIDHLLVTPDLDPVSPDVGTSRASDHLPVSVTLDVEP
ncbi:endonuclease/exonuclease/phosphatase family protein [Aeromicrobium sp.]|uniref:endonuclease/exonuclease/phosphatase family protein n=1 Tax=Aeromicrobium sp. TaxID=1871063 RepID=UPI0028A87B1F|nr:endonuclease/exonuclease/phosphatase family protein [Aeromicrobium sp.]